MQNLKINSFEICQTFQSQHLVGLWKGKHEEPKKRT